MKKIIVAFLVFSATTLLAQEEVNSKFFMGLSYGPSLPLGKFRDTDPKNEDSGFARNGKKIDLFLGYPINKYIVTGVLRYQSFSTEVDDLINDYNAKNPGSQVSGSTEDWQTYCLNIGLAYPIKATKKLNFSPRFGIGPCFVQNPGLNLVDPTGTTVGSFSRSSKTGFGIGYEVGVGATNNFGRHFALMPTFTFSGAFVKIKDVVTTIDQKEIISDYTPIVRSFNLGIALAYIF